MNRTETSQAAFRILSTISSIPFLRSSMARSTSFRTSSYLSLPTSPNFASSKRTCFLAIRILLIWSWYFSLNSALDVSTFAFTFSISASNSLRRGSIFFRYSCNITSLLSKGLSQPPVSNMDSCRPTGWIPRFPSRIRSGIRCLNLASPTKFESARVSPPPPQAQGTSIRRRALPRTGLPGMLVLPRGKREISKRRQNRYDHQRISFTTGSGLDRRNPDPRHSETFELYRRHLSRHHRNPRTDSYGVREEKPMATEKQKEAAKNNIKKAQA